MAGVTAAEREQLDERGWVVLENFMDRALLAELRARIEELFAAEGERAGAEFKQEPETRRLANVVDKGEIFRRVIVTPEVLEYVGHVLGPELKLSSLNVRSANPHSEWIQPLHTDSGAVADERGYWVCNTVWLLDDFTPHNGALRMVPGSHRWGKLPQQALADPAAPHPQQVLLTAPAASVAVMNSHLWHGATANRTGAHRRALHAFYTRRDKPQQQYQKRLLGEETQRALTSRQRWILALDDPLNDELCAEGAGRSGFLK